MKSKINLLLFHFSFLLLISTTVDAAGLFGNWKEIKPMYGTEILALAKHPSGRIFAITLYDGIFFSDNGGTSWKQNVVETNTQAFTTLTIDQSGTIYIGAEPAHGIYYSKDNGDSWNRMNFPHEEESVFCMQAVNNGKLFVGTRYGVYLTENYGVTWQNILSTNFIVRSVAEKDGYVYAMEDCVGLHVTSDQGRTWTLSQLPGLYNYLLTVKNHDEIYVSMTLTSAALGSFYKTNDGGKNWEKINLGSDVGQINCLTETNDGLLLAGDSFGRILKSTNKGSSWNTESTNQPASPVTCFVVDDKSIIAGYRNSGILLKKENEDWRVSNDGFPKQIVRTVFPLKNGSLLFATNAGMYKYDTATNKIISCNNFIFDGNITLYSLSLGMEFDGIIELSDKSLLAYTYQGTLFRSTDDGQSWHVLSTHNSACQVFSVKQFNNDLYYVANWIGPGLFKSIDYGKNWEKVSDNVGFSQALAMDKNNILYAGSKLVLKYSTDFGASWNQFDHWCQTYIVDVLPRESGDLFVVTANTIFKVSNKGTIWKELNVRAQDQIPVLYSKIYAINEQKLVLVSDRGIYYSIDNGTIWQKSDDELSNYKVTSISIATNGNIYAATDHGLFYSESNNVTGISSLELPNNFSLTQNYPNPFNPTTVINYQLPKDGFVTLKVYDILGKEVTTLVNENKQAGYYNVTFNSSNLPSGIYIYSIKADGFSQSKKMLLIK